MIMSIVKLISVFSPLAYLNLPGHFPHSSKEMYVVLFCFLAHGIYMKRHFFPCLFLCPYVHSLPDVTVPKSLTGRPVLGASLVPGGSEPLRCLIGQSLHNLYLTAQLYFKDPPLLRI